MVTKALVNRVQQVIPQLVHTDQKGFVANRYLGENVLEVQTLMTMAENFDQGDKFALFSLDIEKAFDSINWEFMRNTLANFGFPPNFIRWIVTIQQNVQLHIANNGHLSQSFDVCKGVTQGDALSPFLFILMIESLASFVRQFPRVKGMEFMGTEKKVSLVADDSLFALRCQKDNIEYFVTVLNQFQKHSGLRINFEKTRIIPLNPNPTWCDWPSVQCFKIVPYGDPFKYLGTLLSAQHGASPGDNLAINKLLIQDVLKLRPIMTTCISGRILQIKSLIASKFVYLFQLLPNPPDHWFQDMQKICIDHVWDQGRHCISQDKMIALRQEGGFNMLDLRIQNMSLKLSWIN